MKIYNKASIHPLSDIRIVTLLQNYYDEYKKLTKCYNNRKSRVTKINLLFSWGILRNCLILLTASVIPLTPVLVIKVKKFPSLNNHFCLIKGLIGNYISDHKI